MSMRREMGIRTIASLVKWYVCSYVCLLAIAAVLLLMRGMSVSRLVEIFPRLTYYLIQEPVAWVLASVPYLLFLLVRSLVRTYRKGGIHLFLRAVILRVAVPGALISVALLGLRLYTADRTPPYAWDTLIENEKDITRDLFSIDGRHRGVTFSSHRPITAETLDPVIMNNIEWLVLVPYGWQENQTSVEVRRFGGAGNHGSASDAGIVQVCALARARGMHIMLKPQLWLRNYRDGVWLPDIVMESADRWQQWFASYRRLVLHYASLAEKVQARAFCIGTELRGTVREKPDQWRSLIAEIRSVYSGKLTYAANWDQEAEEVQFWGDLDYIGIQAYFPLSRRKEPDLAECIASWQSVAGRLERLSARWKKPVLFTEIGYKSTADAAIYPWKWPHPISGLFKRMSMGTQANAYKAFFNVVWEREWFAGAHVWRWYADHESAGGLRNIDFTPQNKPAQNVIARGFLRVGPRVVLSDATGRPYRPRPSSEGG